MLCNCLLPIVMVLGAISPSNGQQCTTADSAHLTATMKHNASGHWVVVLSIDRALNYEETEPLNLDVRTSTNKHGSIKTKALVVTLSGPPASPPIGLGYEMLNGLGFYKAHPEKLTWDEADAACTSEGAHLLVLNSERESLAIREFLKQKTSVSAWPHIGFHAKEKIGIYLTIFGETLTAAGFDKWSPQEPTNINIERCGGLAKETGGLMDNGCELKQSFVCEF